MTQMNIQQAFAATWRPGAFLAHSRDATAGMEIAEAEKTAFAWKIADLAGGGRKSVSEFFDALTPNEVLMVEAVVDLAALEMETRASMALNEAKRIRRMPVAAPEAAPAQPEDPPTFGAGPEPPDDKDGP
jgi:hypothetical protein